MGDQHPAAPAAEKRQAYGVHQGRPDEFPSKRQADQGKEADGFQIDLLAAQPGGNEIDQKIERQAGGEAGENTNQHPAGENLLPDAGGSGWHNSVL